MSATTTTLEPARENDDCFEQSRDAITRIVQSMPNSKNIKEYGTKWPTSPIRLADVVMNDVMEKLHEAIYDTPLVAMLVADTDNGQKLRYHMNTMWNLIQIIVYNNKGSGQTENERMLYIERSMEYLAANIIFTNLNVHQDPKKRMNFLSNARQSLEELINSRSEQEFERAPSNAMNMKGYMEAVVHENVALAALDEKILQVRLDLSKANKPENGE